MADEKDLETTGVEEEEAVTESGKDEKSGMPGKSEKDAKSADKKKGSGLGKRIVKYFRDLKGEFKKIIWPTLPTVVRNTGVTLAMCAILGLLVCLVDFGLGFLIDRLVSL